MALHISISAEKIATIAGVSFTNSMLASLIVSSGLVLFALWVRASLKNTNRPTGLQNIAEWITESLENLCNSVTNNREKTARFFPFIASFFLFILLNNWFGLLPGVGTIGFFEQEPAAEGKVFVPFLRAATSDLNTTLALGLLSVVLIQIFGIMYVKLGYFKKFINLKSPITFFVGLLEIVSEVSRILSFSFRLFGNVFAGEVLLAVIGSLLPIIGPMPFYGLELFVGFIQALVFSMLSLVLFNMATVSHDEH